MESSNTVNISGIVKSIGLVEQLNPQTLYQVLMLHNVTVTKGLVFVPSKISVVVYYKNTVNGIVKIPFRLNDPISVRGTLSVSGNTTQITNTTSPFGFIRYNGIVYK